MKVRFTPEILSAVAAFQEITHAQVVDCLENDIAIYFVVKEGMRILATGTRGERLARLQQVFKKRVYVIEFSPDLEQFIRNLVPEVQKIEIDSRRVRLRVPKFEKSKVIGKDKRNLKIIEGFLKRLFDVEEVKVI